MSRAQSVLVFLGFVLIVGGVAMLSTPAALMVAGCGLLLDAYQGRVRR